MIKVAIASDHAGFSLKESLKDWLSNNHYVVSDYGCHNNEIVDYPDYAKDVVDNIKSSISDCGVLICGSGIGMSIAANRYIGICAALCHNEDTARLSREHNNANIICLGALFVSVKSAQRMLKVFFNSNFTGGRHTTRVKKLDNLGQNNV